MTKELDHLAINTIRFLAADAVEAAQSGHPGTALGAAPAAYTLWDRILRHSPTQPEWPNRDRFVLSCGHASMLLYSLLHLTGYDISLDDLKQFRTWGSLTPGHPEYGHTPGVEVTTGPLGQGLTNAVGMAMGEAHLAARFNKPDHAPIVDHFTYVLASDGDLMEGLSSEAASLAGHLKLGKLICLYDDNHVSIEGATALTFTEDTLARFESYGWHVQRVDDCHDLDEIEAAIHSAQAIGDQPSLIAIRSVIGYGVPSKQGKSAAHAGAFGPEELAKTKENLGWSATDMFTVPAEVSAYMGQAVDKGQRAVADWQANFEAYRQSYPQEASAFERALSGELPATWEEALPSFDPEITSMATRLANAPIINALADTLPELMGGSADLAPATMTLIDGSGDFGPEDYAGRNIRFGVREHAMGAIANGLALHGGILPYCATFLTFYDYMRPPVRLAAMMKLHVIFIFTHDSIGLGEDGPTHQPVEQIVGLRSVPDLVTIRPSDINETLEAWRVAVKRTDGPTCILLTRQALPVIDRTQYAPADGLARGAYVLADSDQADPDVILIATGSEVQVALAARTQLAEQGIQARVVAMPSWELFAQQSDAYRESVLPAHIKDRVAIEAGSTLGWERWVGERGIIIGLDRFGASAPFPTLLEKFGFTPEHVVQQTLDLLGEKLQVQG